MNIARLLPAAALGSFALAAAAHAAPANVQSRLQENWRADIANTPVPAEGCFKAEFPSKTWQAVSCVKAPRVPYIPRHATRVAGGQTVGDGDDYAAAAHGRITSATGSFHNITGLKSETDSGANIYSLQLNSNFISGGAACKTSSDPANCFSWEQFVYSSSSQASFIQYWLINYGDKCPTTPYNDWNNYQGSCYRNSNAVSVPQEPIKALGTITIKGVANTSTDSFVTTVGTKAYSTGGKDNVVFLASGWAANEFNVVGDGNGSGATFNAGTSITVHLAQQDGTTTAPTCESMAGTTGETNNLTLGACKTAGGHLPYISFIEKN